MKCRWCKSKKNSRNLVVCIDGTSNKFGDKVSSLIVYFKPVPFLQVRRTQTFSSCIASSTKVLSQTRRLGITAASARTLALHGNRGVTTSKPSKISWIWQLHGTPGALLNVLAQLMEAYRNFENIIIKAYRWLSDMYEDGDCIYLFGAVLVTCNDIYA
jgi:uncharacterized protein (DUF2235 family)